jgi:nucleoside-diphosphate-sugar epimerase
LGDVSGLSDDFASTAVDASLSLLRAAKRVTSVKRIVLTSSSDAVILPPSYRDKVLTGDDWNDEAVEKFKRRSEEDVKSPSWDWIVYAAAKTLAERAAWEFVEREKVRLLSRALPLKNCLS